LCTNPLHYALPIWSPTGWRETLWLRSFDSLAAAALPGTELVDSAFWSPDGSSLAFFAAGKLKRLDLPSGSPQIICETPVGRSSGTWSRSGAFRSDCEKFRIAKNIVSNLAGGSPRFPFTYFNQTPGRGRVHIGTHWFRTDP